nr:hypothetical protein [Tenacibaculum piscium]
MVAPSSTVSFSNTFPVVTGVSFNVDTVSGSAVGFSSFGTIVTSTFAVSFPPFPSLIVYGKVIASPVPSGWISNVPSDNNVTVPPVTLIGVSTTGIVPLISVIVNVSPSTSESNPFPLFDKTSTFTNASTVVLAVSSSATGGVLPIVTSTFAVSVPPFPSLIVYGKVIASPVPSGWISNVPEH